ncbi:MAG: aldehyde ferredoxin oxidoreductase N-terminal domain-containing protein, partial [Thermodesulfobacteriota bacterium]
MKPFGWTGKILWVDLTDRKIKVVPTSDFEPEKYLGGVGLNSKIFWELGCPKVEAFDAQSPLLIAIGPLTGMAGPFGRSEVCGIAPQSYPQETFAYSGIGGKIPVEIKYAGYDGLVIVGKSDQPVYLSIIDDQVKLNDAKTLWGLDTFETQKTLMNTHPKSSVLAIGTAGENLCRVAIILNETGSAAGQGGYGAVMGSKKLKAIVVKGSGSIKVAKPETLMKIQKQRMEADEWLKGGAQTWGRSPLCGGSIAQEMRSKGLKRIGGCHGCTYQCMGFYDVPGIGKGAQMCVEAWYGWFSGGSSEGYWEGNILSQKLGINNYELLGIMSWLLAMRGSVDKKALGLTSIPIIDHYGQPQLGGREAHHQFLTELLGGMAGGKSLLSQGVGRAAEKLGPTAKAAFNATFPARGYTSHHIENVGSALHWALDSRDPYNSCHDYTFPFQGFGYNTKVAEHFGLPGGDMIGTRKNVYDRTEFQTAWVQNHQNIKNSLPICEYSSMPGSFFHPPAMDIRIFEAGVLSAVTGIDYSVERLWEAGERIANL